MTAIIALPDVGDGGGSWLQRRSGMSIFDGRSVLITGGTGSFGKRFVSSLLSSADPKRVVIFSRDELKQYEMQQLYPGESRLRFFIGDVRDRDRLYRAFHDVNFVVHAAALKQVPAAEYNPFEAVKTNVNGAQNVIEAAIDQGVERVVALSTDKASSPINLYGATKLVSDKLFIAGNAYAGGTTTRFAVVRYGNVVGSRGSVVPYFRERARDGVLPITDERMTRFWITLERGVQFVRDSLTNMHGGELFVPKIPSMRVVDLARAIAPDARLEVVGIRPGEKLHEEMIAAPDARRTMDMGSYYVIQPEMEWWPDRRLDGTPVDDEFSYSSDKNSQWLTVDELRETVAHV
jgi:UDP-N-acetylglucosamine 4,6-dehydratase/5-epimerase